jgi:hypothetical protein
MATLAMLLAELHKHEKRSITESGCLPFLFLPGSFDK